MRPTVGAVAGAAAVAISIIFLASPAFAGVPKTGDAVVVSTTGTHDPIAGGGSTTTFTIRLPEGAACPGDSEEAQYRVQSFLIPASADPGAVVYKGQRPQLEGAWALYRTDTTTYMNAPTNKAARAGGEGEIINIPNVSFKVFSPGMIKAGRYHLGIACSRFAETKRYWSTDVDVTADPGDKPAGIAWKVLDPPASGTGAGGSLPVLPFAVGLGAVAVVAVVLLVARREPRVSAVGEG